MKWYEYMKNIFGKLRLRPRFWIQENFELRLRMNSKFYLLCIPNRPTWDDCFKIMSEIYFRYRRFGNRETKLFGDIWDKWHKLEGGRFTARVKLRLRLWLRLRIQENYESSPDELKCLASLHPHNWPQQKCYNWPLSCSAMFGTYVTCNELAKTATTPLERHCNKNCSGKCDYFLWLTACVFLNFFDSKKFVLFSSHFVFCAKNVLF